MDRLKSAVVQPKDTPAARHAKPVNPAPAASYHYVLDVLDRIVRPELGAAKADKVTSANSRSIAASGF
jgi:hypothetical protein